jgi:hypothetical protein
MASRQDVQKRRTWEVRFGRFRASGLTVARFCEQEGVSAHSFYYWTKRVGSASGRRSSSTADCPSRRGRQSVKHTPTAAGISNAALVHFYQPPARLSTGAAVAILQVGEKGGSLL